MTEQKCNLIALKAPPTITNTYPGTSQRHKAKQPSDDTLKTNFGSDRTDIRASASSEGRA